ncbi:MAG: DNA-methyltransferase [Lachnospiraceae bacterium]
MQHEIINGDARKLGYLMDESVHLIVTSPPYWNLKPYNQSRSQLGLIQDYDQFVKELDKVWKECLRVLVPGGRLICVAGDVCLSRRRYGRHMVMPLHSDIQVHCRKLGFDNLNPILWYKISNVSYEANRTATFLGKPYEPNGIVKNDMEYILMFRKPGAYRNPTEEQRMKSKIAPEDYNKWFTQIWAMPGASTRKHPAPFPLELASRLVQMFSFYGDTILDPFCGSGTTLLAAENSGRNSIGIEIEKEYCYQMKRRLRREHPDAEIKMTKIKKGERTQMPPEKKKSHSKAKKERKK